MLIVGYCYGIRFERKLCEEVEPHLAYRWFCRLDLDDLVPDHSTFSVNRHGRFPDSDIFRHVFEAVVGACMNAGLVKGQGFAVDASVMEVLWKGMPAGITAHATNSISLPSCRTSKRWRTMSGGRRPKRWSAVRHEDQLLQLRSVASASPL